MGRQALLVWICLLVAPLFVAGCSDDGVDLGEMTVDLCTDGKDNDGDGQIDCEDKDCLAFVLCHIDGWANLFDGGVDGDGKPPPPKDQGVDGKPPTCGCDDNLDCTDDTCDAAGTCSYKVKPDYCAIMGGCFKKGDKNGTICEVCDPTKSQTSWTPIIGGCTIANICYAKGETDDSGCLVCNPNKSSTEWSPGPAPDCLIANHCYVKGETDESGCNVCDPTQSTTDWSTAQIDCTIDGKCYVNGDKHPSTTCTSAVCDSTVTTSLWTVKGTECVIGETCKQAGDRSPDGCEVCNPTLSKISWSPGSFDCKIGGACYLNGEKHPSPACTTVVCDKSQSDVMWTVSGNECLIGDVCRQPGNRTANGCLMCEPAVSKTEWSPATYDCKIDGACLMDGDKHPSPTCTDVVCDKAFNTTGWTVKGNECLIGNVCYKAGDKNANGCEECNPTLSKVSWSPMSTGCQINNVCYLNGDKHPNPTCTSVVCNTSVSTTSWTVTGNECLIGADCHQSGAQHPTGCLSCDPTKSKTSWSPMTTCSKILFIPLNEAHDGNLGGIAGANALCASQAAAAGFPGTWKAFLSSSTQNVKDLITGTAATTVPVVNGQGQQMYPSWSAVFTQTSWASTANYLYTFNGTQVLSGAVSPNWYDADGWHGSNPDGTVHSSGYTCTDWTVNTTSTSYRGANGEWDLRQMFNNEADYCYYTLAVGCVMTTPATP